MQNDFEIIYYCMLNDDVALQIYLEQFRRYLWGMLHRIIYRADRRNEVFEMGAYDLLIDLLYGVNTKKVNNIKAFYSSSLMHEIKRINTQLSRKDAHSCYMDDVDTYANLIACSHLKDELDPQYWDNLALKCDQVKDAMVYNLSYKQKLALSNAMNGLNEKGFKDVKSFHNALYQARKKIKTCIED